MKKRLLLTAMSATLSLGILGACGAGNNNLNDGDGTDYRPVRYDRQDDGMFDNRNMNNRGNQNNRGTGGDNDGLFDINNNRNNDGLFDGNTDLFDNDNNNRVNNGTTGTNQGNGTMRGRTTGQ